MKNVNKYQRVCGLCSNTFETKSEIAKICPFCQEEVARLTKDLPEEEKERVKTHNKLYRFGL